MLQGWKIWDIPGITDRNVDDVKRLELTDLIRFKDHWYCGLHEGTIHSAHPAGMGRILRSADGIHWESATLLQWDGGDVRDPKFSITSHGQLMINTSVAFVSKTPRHANKKQREANQFFIPENAAKERDQTLQYFQLDEPGTPETDEESQITRQSVTWLSEDGRNWSSVYACPTGVNAWRWETRWHNGMGYSISYVGKDHRGTLYRTRDGKSWRPLLENFFPPQGTGNETTLAFDKNDTAICLARDAKLRNKPLANSVGTSLPMLGIGKPPYYTQWQWHELKVDYGSDFGGIKPVDEVFRAPFGGPKLIDTSDGRFFVAARMLANNQNDGKITIYQLHPDKALLTFVAMCDGASYGGLAEHDGQLWVTYCNNSVTEIHIASLPLPPI